MVRETELHDDDAVAARLATLEGGPEEKEAAETEVDRDTSTGDAGDADEKPEDADTDEDAEEEESEAGESKGEISTLEQVAKAFQIEPEEFLKTIQVAGPDGKLVPLGEIVSHYRRDAAARELPAQLHAKRLEYETLRSQVEQERGQALRELKTAIGENLKHLKASQEIDWDRLKEEDSNQYAVKRTEFLEQRLAAQHAVAMMEREQSRNEQQANVAREKWYGEERVKLLTARPEWTDPNALNAALGSVASYLTTLGFDPQDAGTVDLIMDHRILQIVHKAAEFDALAKKSEKTIASVKKLPRLVRPEARGEEQGRSAGRLQKARATLRTRGDIESLAAALGEMGG